MLNGVPQGSVLGPVLLTFHMLHLENIVLLLRNWSSDHIITTDGLSLALSWSVSNAGGAFDQPLSSNSHIKLTGYKGGPFFTSVTLQSWERNATATAIILRRLMPRENKATDKLTKAKRSVGLSITWLESIKWVTCVTILRLFLSWFSPWPKMANAWLSSAF